MSEAFTIYRRHIPERAIPGRPLGRHVHHDSRSMAYLVRPTGVVASKRWERVTPVLDQGQLGSCVGNATCGVLGSRPLYDALSAKITSGLKLDEAEAVRLYHLATQLDPYSGEYPPTDTGSDGLSGAKAAKAEGLISGYLHMVSVSACQTAIQTGPFIIGSDWYEGFDSPDPKGKVVISGSVRGGHEYECVGYDAPNDTWELVNSWGTSYGVTGHFFYSSATFNQLLKSDGDATLFVPITQPAPTPTPTPTPVPPQPGNPDLRLVPEAKIFTARHHIGENEKMAKAVRSWLSDKGY